MLTLTSQYALQGLIHMAQQAKREPLSAKQIAEQTDIPAKYLSNILGTLVHEGVLESTRGKGGGFFLTQSPKKIFLWDIVYAFEPQFRSKRKCPFGNSECCDHDPCMAHFEWKEIIEHEKRFLQKKTLHDISMKLNESTVKKTRKKKKRGTRNALHILS